MSADGRPVPPENLHLTLLFLGDVPTDSVAVMREIVNGMESPPIALELDVFGSFRQHRARILWVGPTESPATLVSLHQSLRRQVGLSGLSVRTGTFRPHVTLVRKARDGEPLPERPTRSIAWTIRHCTLVASDLRPEGPRYTVLAEQTLSGLG